MAVGSFFSLCSPDCPKQPRTSFPFYKFFYPTISGRISASTLWIWKVETRLQSVRSGLLRHIIYGQSTVPPIQCSACALVFVCWELSHVIFSCWERKNCFWSRANSQNDNYFNSKLSYVVFEVKIVANLPNAYPRISTTIFYLIWILKFFWVFLLVM